MLSCCFADVDQQLIIERETLEVRTKSAKLRPEISEGSICRKGEGGKFAWCCSDFRRVAKPKRAC